MRGEIFQNGLEGDLKGYAWVRVILDPEDQIVFAENDSIAIGRYEGAVLEFLQPSGGDNWSGAPARLMLVEPPRIGGNYADFLIQPAYVDQLSDMPYDIYLQGKNGEIKGQAPSVYFDNVQYSPLKGTNTVQSYEPEAAGQEPAREDAAAATAAAAVTAAETPLQDTAMEAPQDQTPGMEGEPEQAYQADQYPPQYPDQLPYPEQADQYPPQYPDQPPYPDYVKPRKSGALMWTIIIIIILLLAGGGGAYYYMYKDQGFNPFAKKETPDVMQDSASVAAQRAEDEARRAQARLRQEERAQQAQQGDTVARVNQFFAGQRDPVTAMRLAQEVPKDTSEQKDAVFRLYYYAAQTGEPEAMRMYAESIDPSKPAWGTIKKDGAEAWAYYGRLPDGQGEEARAKLKEWTENQARTGNSAARDWLSSME